MSTGNEQGPSQSSEQPFRYLNGVLVGVAIGIALILIVMAFYGFSAKLLLIGVIGVFDPVFLETLGGGANYVAITGGLLLIACYFAAGKTKQRFIELAASIISCLVSFAFAAFLSFAAFVVYAGAH